MAIHPDTWEAIDKYRAAHPDEFLYAIADHFGVSSSAIKMRDLRLSRRQPGERADQWPVEWEEELRTMVLGHRSFGQIAQRMEEKFGTPFSRNAVIAKADRMKLKRHDGIGGGAALEPISPAMQRLAQHCPVTRRAMLKKMGAEAPELPTSNQDADED